MISDGFLQNFFVEGAFRIFDKDSSGTVSLEVSSFFRRLFVAGLNTAAVQILHTNKVNTDASADENTNTNTQMQIHKDAALSHLLAFLAEIRTDANTDLM